MAKREVGSALVSSQDEELWFVVFEIKSLGGGEYRTKPMGWNDAVTERILLMSHEDIVLLRYESTKGQLCPAY